MFGAYHRHLSRLAAKGRRDRKALSRVGVISTSVKTSSGRLDSVHNKRNLTVFARSVEDVPLGDVYFESCELKLLVHTQYKKPERHLRTDDIIIFDDSATLL